jgi:hypothetical protein
VACGLITDDVSPSGTVKALVDEAIDQDPLLPPQQVPLHPDPLIAATESCAVLAQVFAADAAGRFIWLVA